MNISSNTKVCALAEKLYITSFPKEERMPLLLMRLLALKQEVDFNCYYENGEFCGFTYMASEGNVLFVLFFAVETKLRQKGYGSAILEYIKENNPSKTIVLNVELLDETADNYEERVKRFAFYKKNGFYDTGYDIEEIGGVFRVLSTSKNLNTDEYLRVFQKMSFGLWNPRIMKVE